MSSIRIPTNRQGQTGMGQGGYTSHQFVQAIGERVTVALRSAIPLETDLEILQTDEHWHLVNPADPSTIILEATRWDPHYASTEPVSVEQAEVARSSFPLTIEDHPAPHCLSCGFDERSLGVHAGPVGDGRWATPFTPPEWAFSGDGGFDESLLWMAMDCSCGWYISHSSVEQRQALTVQFAVDVYDEISRDDEYALVAWNGDFQPAWDGRKRGASAALFASNGRCVAESRSFWVSVA